MKKIATILSIPVLLIAIILFTQKVQANRSYFVPSVTTAAATTSVDYMRTANATLTLDAYTYQTGAINSATLLIQSVASTSAAVQTITIDYSQDGIDWFNDELSTTTTAATIALNNTPGKYTITGNAVSSTTRIALSIPTPTRFVRATVATSTALSSVWMQWVPLREMVQ